MLWYVELIAEFTLLLWLAFNRDGRPKFEAMLWADFLTQIFQVYGQRTGQIGLFGHVWYVGAILGFPLMAIALTEAADYRPTWHRTILYWWVAAAFCCAWVRIFPYTNQVLLCINTAAFALWFILAVSSDRRRHPHHV